MTDIDLVKLKERYSESEVPPCRVCGGELSIQRAGSGPTVWGCTGMVDDPTGERNWIYAEGRSCADEHYERSRWSDYRQGGDSDVIALIEQLEAAQRERDEAIKQKNESGDRFYKAVQYGARLEAELKRRDAAAGEPEFYVRYRSDGGFEGPLHKDATEQVRKDCWSPLYTANPAAANSPVIPDGWKLVPSAGLTQEMAEACKCVHAGLSVWKHNDIYLAALNAAPVPGDGEPRLHIKEQATPGGGDA